MGSKTFVCSVEEFHHLLDLMKKDEYELLGPTIRNNALIYDEIQSAKDLPIGWVDEQDPGRYRIQRRSDKAYFGYNVGQHSWKQFLFPSREKLFTATKQSNGIVVFQETKPKIPKMAFIGVHACDIQAILVQDLVFNSKLAAYPQYHERRKNIFILAVNCTQCVNTCFCASMGSGPEVTKGYDLALTEVIQGKEHFFVIDVGSSKGQLYCDQLKLKSADPKQCQRAKDLVQENRDDMKRFVNNDRVQEMLLKSWNCKRWDQVAERCINCANCTLVCPTCFCCDMEEKVSLNQSQDDRWQSWDSCFNLSHSYIHGGCVRQSAKSRYRQWLTHKFGTWWNQFGLSGCVGCGRCITWCPVGIDVTEELSALFQEMDKVEK